MLKNIVFEECIICGLYVFLCFYYSYYINILWLCFKEKNLSIYLAIYYIKIKTWKIITNTISI